MIKPSLATSGWTDDELTRIGDAIELQLASHRPDATLRRYTTKWVVRVGDHLYVRSAGAKYDHYGPGPVSHVTGSGAHLVTMRLVRREP